MINNKINPRLKRDFQKYLEDANKPTTSYYSGSGYTYNFTPPTHSSLVQINHGHDDFRECGKNPLNYVDRVNVFFYEFSSLDKGCRHYNSFSEFLSFISQYGMIMSDESRRIVKIGSPCWCICVPNKKEVIVKRMRKSLDSFVEKYCLTNVEIPASELKPEWTIEHYYAH